MLGNEPLGDVLLQLHHDEDAEIYLNGALAASAPGFASDYYQPPLAPEAAAGLKPGKNLMAAHCHQTTGGQFIDAGLVVRPSTVTRAR